MGALRKIGLCLALAVLAQALLLAGGAKEGAGAAGAEAAGGAGAAAGATGAGKTGAAAGAPRFSVLVYVTGVVSGSPSYELLARGAADFQAARPEAEVKVYEAGYNQAEWEGQLEDLVSSGDYDVVVSSNPAMPEICAAVARKFPSCRFIITDAEMEGDPRIRTYLFNQYEQSYILGYLAGLVTTSSMERANPAKKIGFIAAQEYPMLNKHIVPGFLDGARRADPAIELDYRVIGNWYDAQKCAELASSMAASGCDVIASIAGGADAGLFTEARKDGAYLVCHNIDAYDKAPGLVVGCGKMGQRELVARILEEALEGRTAYGEATLVSVADGCMDFIDDSPLFGSGLSPEVRDAFEAFLSEVRSGRIILLPPCSLSNPL